MEANLTNKEKLTPVVVTIANNDTNFVIRVSDRGGGIREDLLKKVAITTTFFSISTLCVPYIML